MLVLSSVGVLVLAVYSNGYCKVFITKKFFVHNQGHVGLDVTNIGVVTEDGGGRVGAIGDVQIERWTQL